MRVTVKISRVFFILALTLVVVGALFLKPVIFALGGVIALLTRKLTQAPTRADRAAAKAASPDVLYWSRSLVLSSISVFVLGFLCGTLLFRQGFRLEDGSSKGYFLLIVLSALLTGISLMTLPKFFESSWTLYGMDRVSDSDVRSSGATLEVHWHRFIVRATASCLFIAAMLVGLCQ